MPALPEKGMAAPYSFELHLINGLIYFLLCLKFCNWEPDSVLSWNDPFSASSFLPGAGGKFKAS